MPGRVEGGRERKKWRKSMGEGWREEEESIIDK